MHKRISLIFAMLIAFGIGSAASAASNYKIDTVHSFVTFKVKHLGVANAWGRFNEPTGTMTWDADNPSAGKFDVVIQASKVDTANTKRDEHLRSPDFFNARQFPTITFKSTSIEKLDDNKFEMAGDLTLHGTTKPVKVELVKVGEADTRQGPKIGFDATFTIKRSEFGMNYMLEGLGDEVTIYVAIEAVRE